MLYSPLRTFGIFLPAVLLSPLNAQTIRGVVLEAFTSEAVPGAEIFLLDTLGATVVFEVTDNDGQFVMSPPPGRYAFQALRMGYAPTVTPELEISPNSPPIDLTILLPSERVVLDPIVVSETREPFAPGPLQGFYERKRRGWGVQLTREDIEKKIPARFTDIVRGLPGVRVKVVGHNKYAIQMSGQIRLAPSGYFNSGGFMLPGKDGTLVNALPCPISYYVDGIRFRPGDMGIDEIMVSEVEAVEVYRRASETPADYIDSDSRCGVILIWTKRGS